MTRMSWLQVHTRGARGGGKDSETRETCFQKQTGLDTHTKCCPLDLAQTCHQTRLFMSCDRGHSSGSGLGRSRRTSCTPARQHIQLVLVLHHVQHRARLPHEVPEFVGCPRKRATFIVKRD
jgi:hypothetical protein